MGLTQLELDAEVLETLPEREVMGTIRFGSLTIVGYSTAIANQLLSVNSTNIAISNQTFLTTFNVR